MRQDVLRGKQCHSLSRLPGEDDLMLDAREADAAGLSYGNWRAKQLMEKQKLRQQAEENRRRKAADAGKEEQP